MKKWLARLRSFRSSLIAAGILSAISVLIIDQAYRFHVKNSFMAIITANKNAIDLEDYFQALLATERFGEEYPSFQSTAFYARDKRVSGSSEWPEFLSLDSSEHLLVKGNLLQGYTAYFRFQNKDYVLAQRFYHENAALYLAAIFILCIFASVLFLFLTRRFDLDGAQKIRNDFAVSLGAKAIHFVKTHIHYANEVYKWLRELHQDGIEPNIDSALSGFEKSQIEMEGIRSILRIASFTKVQGYLNVEENIAALIDCYRNEKIVVQTYYGHQSLLHVDRDIFIATVGNLIKNACEYSFGLVWIKTEEHGDTFIISVSNTGEFLKVSKLRKIVGDGRSFEGSTGLGLSICQVWMEKIGGNLTIHSSMASNTFELAFPNKPAKRIKVEAKVEPKEHFSGQHQRIALIEDLPSFQEKLKNQFADLGISLECFSDADSFFAFFEEKHSTIDAVVCDRHLLGFDSVRDRFPDACRYYGFTGKLILYTHDLSPAENKGANHQFDLVIQKDAKVDWREIIA